MNHRKLLLLGLGWLSGLSLLGQKPSEYAELYGDSRPVRLADHTTLDITLKKDQLQIEKNTLIKTYLAAKNPGRDQVNLEYEPPFTEVTKVKSYMLVPREGKDKFKKYKVRDYEDLKMMDQKVFHDGTRAKSFRFEHQCQGAIASIEYTKKYYEPRLLGREIFSSSIPTQEQMLELRHSTGVELSFDYYNCDSSFFEYRTWEKRGKRHHRWILRNLTPRNSYSSSPGLLHYAPHIVYRIESFEKKDGQRENILRNEKDLYHWYSHFLSELNDSLSPALQSITDSIVQTSEAGSYALAKNIYRWVSHAVRYVAFEDGLGGFRPRQANLVCDRRYGDCKDMSNLMVQMMRYAGLDAYHVWIGTRRLPYTYRQLPSPLSDNHMIAALRLQDSTYFLDPTNKHLPFPYPSSFTQGKEALISIDKEQFELGKVSVLTATQNREHDRATLHLEGVELLGRGQKEYHGYNYSPIAQRFERRNQSNLKSFIKSEFEKGSNRCNAKHSDYSLSDSVASINYQFNVPAYAVESGEALFVNLNLVKHYSQGKIKANREVAIEKDYHEQVKEHYRLAIPQGYRIESLPAVSESNHPLFNHHISYNQEGDTVVYNLEINLHFLQLTSEHFDDWNQFVNTLRKAYQQSLKFIRHD